MFDSVAISPPDVTAPRPSGAGPRIDQRDATVGEVLEVARGDGLGAVCPCGCRDQGVLDRDRFAGSLAGMADLAIEGGAEPIERQNLILEPGVKESRDPVDQVVALSACGHASQPVANLG